MSALARLVARATGQAATGLTPRLPARFETAPGDPAAPIETAATEPAAPASRSAPAAEAPENPPRPAPPAARAPDPNPLGASLDRPEPVAATHPGHPRSPETTVPPSPPGPLLRETASPVLPLHHAALPPAPPPFDTLASRPAPPAEQAPQTLPRGDLATSAPPEPLLPPAPPRATPPSQQARAPDGPAAPAMTRLAAAAPAPQPPEITVHIGRLHVVTEPREARVPRATAERPAPRADTLSDYLRGKGSAS